MINKPILTIKETKRSYVIAIFCAGLLFAGMTTVGVLMINSQLLEPGININMQHNLYIFGIIFILIFAFGYAGLLIYWILSMTKKRIEFYDDKIAIMIGTKQLYGFYYADIENYYIIKLLSNCSIVVSKFNQYRHGEVLRKRVFDLSLTRETLKRVSEIIKEKTPLRII